MPKTSKSKFNSSIAVCLAIHPLIPVNKTLSVIFLFNEKDVFLPAAMHPIPAAVTACLNILSLTSPAANTPGTLVSVESGLVT